MDPLRISAQFAAYVWYTTRVTAGREPEAAAFAKTNWPSFLPLAHAGLGRLLGKIARRNPRTIAKEKPDMPKLSKLQTLTRALHKHSWPLKG
jgi:hypothetical protein